MTQAEVVEAQGQVREVKVGEAVLDYILGLVEATRSEPKLKLGSSPRGSLALYRAVQAHAFSHGRDYTTPDDVRAMAGPVLAHRLVLDTKARYSGTTKESVIEELLGRVEVPT